MPGQNAGPEAQERPKNPEESVINGGLGNLDIGVLNARAGIRQQGGDEILERVQGILEELEKEKEGGERKGWVLRFSKGGETEERCVDFL